MFEFSLFLLMVIILIVVLGIKNSLAERLDALERRLDSLLVELRKLGAGSEVPRLPEKEKPVKPVIPEITEASVLESHEEREKFEVTEEIGVKKAMEEVAQSSSQPYATVKKESPIKLVEPVRPGFFERNPDLEKFIGENLANKIGIGVLVLGIGFFVKYAIDQDWINEIGRVFIGILCGGVLLGVAHRLRKTFVAFSSVLVGGGIAVLYVTIAIAFHQYQIFSQVAAFAIMVFITGLAVIFSVAYNRIELAIVSLLGGFASPFMVSTGDGNYVILFIYILILDGGMLVLAYFKRWNLVNIVAFVFTLLLFGSWLGLKYNYEVHGMTAGAFTFASLFYIVFFAMNLVNNVKSRTTFNTLEITLILSNTFLYYSAGMFILANPNGRDFQGLFTASLGVFNFVFTYLLYNRMQVDRKLMFLLLGLVLTFITLAAPVQLEGNYITLFWAAEAVLLLWLSQKSGIELMKLSSVILTVLMVLSLLIDWTQIYGSTGVEFLPVIFNKGYITALFSLISISLTIYFLRKESEKFAQYVVPYFRVLIVAFVVLLYMMNLLELRHQLIQYDFVTGARNVIIGCYNMLFLAAILYVGRNRTKLNERMFLGFTGITGLLSFLIYYHFEIIEQRDFYLIENGIATGFMFHYLFVLLLIGVAYLSLKKMQTLTSFNLQSKFVYSWFYVFFFVFLASAELDHTVLLMSNANGETLRGVLAQNHKIGYPILWGLTSFLLIFVGLKSKKKQLRIISLTLFLITLLKLFLIDIRGISEGGKIAAFISLGVLLLIVSFMYQRLKKLLLDEEMVKSEKIEG